MKVVQLSLRFHPNFTKATYCIQAGDKTVLASEIFENKSLYAVNEACQTRKEEIEKIFEGLSFGEEEWMMEKMNRLTSAAPPILSSEPMDSSSP